MDIQITTKKSEGVERLLEVSVPAGHGARRRGEDGAKRYATSVRLPGFRPGKAPAAMVRKRFKDAIRQQVLETLVQEAFKEVMEREKLDVASQPHVHDVKFEDDKPLTFELHLEVRPKIELARTEGFRVTRTAHDGDRRAGERADRAAARPEGDLGAGGGAAARGRHGDGAARHAGRRTATRCPRASEYRLVLGGGQAIPGIEELIMELTPGETMERSVKWPDDFPDEAQRGKTKHGARHAAGREAQVARRRSTTRSRARSATSTSLDALRAAVRKDLEEHATRDADAAVRQQLLDQIVAANPFDVPPSWVSQLIDALHAGVPDPRRGARAVRAASSAAVAERQVRRDLVIETIAEQREARRRARSDVDDRVAEGGRASAAPIRARCTRRSRRRDACAEIERSITEEKVFEWLLGHDEVEAAPTRSHRAPSEQCRHGHDLPAVRHRALQPRRAHATTSSRGC